MTIEQFAIKVLSRIGVYSRSTLDAADLENVNDAYQAVYYTLADDGLVTWAITDDIPIRFTLPLTLLVAAEIGPFYNIPEIDPRLKQLAVNSIRRQLASGQDPEPVTAEYF